MCDKANYFAILPSAVRYNPKLTSRAILLYGLFVSLSCGGGEIFASNKYIADALNVSERTAIRLIGELEDEKYISIRYEYKDGTKEITRRYIRRNELPLLLFDLPNTADYAVIPTHILSMRDLSVQSKLLYVEISAATPTDGYCSKPAMFFAELLHISETTIQRCTRELIHADALRVEMEYKDGTREVCRRRIYLTAAADIVEKQRQIASNGLQADESGNKPDEPLMSNSLNYGHILGGDKNDTTNKTTISGNIEYVRTRHTRRLRHGKRRKNTEKLRL